MQGRPQRHAGQPAVVRAAVVFAPRGLARILVQVLVRDVVVLASDGPAQAREVRLGLIGAGAIPAIGFAVVARLWGATIVLLWGLTIWFAWQGSGYLREVRVKNDAEAKYHREYAVDRIEKNCLIRDATAPLHECIQKEIEASYDHERSNRDIRAQEAMAFWAMAMTGVTFLTLLVTGAGVVFVWLTLKETAAGVLVMRHEQRPWLTMHVRKDIELPFYDGNGYIAKWRYSLQNFGKSPAQEARISSQILRLDQSISLIDKVNDFLSRRIAEEKPGIRKMVVFPGNETDEDRQSVSGKIDTEGTSLYLITCIVYAGEGIEGNAGECRAFIISPAQNSSSSRTISEIGIASQIR